MHIHKQKCISRTDPSQQSLRIRLCELRSKILNFQIVLEHYLRCRLSLDEFGTMLINLRPHSISAMNGVLPEDIQAIVSKLQGPGLPRSERVCTRPHAVVCRPGSTLYNQRRGNGVSIVTSAVTAVALPIRKLRAMTVRNTQSSHLSSNGRLGSASCLCGQQTE